MSDLNTTSEPTDYDTDATPTAASVETTTESTSASASDGATNSTTETDSSTDQLGTRGADDDNPASKDPADWVTGDEPMTAAQQSYLDTLAREAGDELPSTLTKAEASVEIDRLQSKTGRG